MSRRRGREDLRADWSYEVLPEFICVVDRDGPVSVTNDAERVVATLAAQGLLEGRRVLYEDSTGRWDELLVRDGRFAGFGPIGAKSQAAAVELAQRTAHRTAQALERAIGGGHG